MSGCWILLSLLSLTTFKGTRNLRSVHPKEVYHGFGQVFLNLPLFFGVCESSFIGLLASCGTYFGTSNPTGFPIFDIF